MLISTLVSTKAQTKLPIFYYELGDNHNKVQNTKTSCNVDCDLFQQKTKLPIFQYELYNNHNKVQNAKTSCNIDFWTSSN